jgi:hypothetical protein
MVRYEPPSITSRCLPSLASLTSKCLPFYMGLRRPFKPKILRLFLAVAFWIISFGWMIISGKLAALRAPKDGSILPDLLFDILPEHKLYPLPDILLYVLLTSVIGRIIFHSDGVAIARRFAAISGCVYMFRSVVLLATSFPNPQVQCMNYTPNWGFSGSLKSSCADMTGHIVNMCLAALCWGQYTKHIFISATAWLFVLSGMVAVIVSRSNYTVDVLISLFTAIFFWRFYHLSLSLPPERRNRVVRWLEKAGAVENQNPELGSPVPGKFVELEESSSNLNLSPVTTRYQELNESKTSSPIASRFIELTGAPGPSYKELSCVIK